MTLTVQPPLLRTAGTGLSPQSRSPRLAPAPRPLVRALPAGLSPPAGFTAGSRPHTPSQESCSFGARPDCAQGTAPCCGHVVSVRRRPLCPSEPPVRLPSGRPLTRLGSGGWGKGRPEQAGGGGPPLPALGFQGDEPAGLAECHVTSQSSGWPRRRGWGRGPRAAPPCPAPAEITENWVQAPFEVSACHRRQI